MIGARSPLGPSLTALAIVLGSAGCVSSTFVATDARAYGRPSTRPEIFIDRLPQVAYYSVGIIEVSSPAGTELGKVLDEARRKGGEIGCDMVVDRAIYRVSYGIPGGRALVAQVIMAPPPPSPPPSTVGQTPIYTPPPDRREFICGVASVPAPTSAASAAAPAAGSGDQRPGRAAAGADVRTAPSDVAPVLVHLSTETEVSIGRVAREGWRAVTLPDGRAGYARESDVRAR
jgi:hypothetical protein